jgi:hypothetical protein
MADTRNCAPPLSAPAFTDTTNDRAPSLAQGIVTIVPPNKDKKLVRQLVSPTIENENSLVFLVETGVRLSLMTLRRVALETIDEPGFGRPEGEPVAPGLLQRNEELPTALHGFRVQFVATFELGLESKLAA